MDVCRSSSGRARADTRSSAPSRSAPRESRSSLRRRRSRRNLLRQSVSYTYTLLDHASIAWSCHWHAPHPSPLTPPSHWGTHWQPGMTLVDRTAAAALTWAGQPVATGIMIIVGHYAGRGARMEHGARRSGRRRALHHGGRAALKKNVGPGWPRRARFVLGATRVLYCSRSELPPPLSCQ
jgi:hypothetical protein